MTDPDDPDDPDGDTSVIRKRLEEPNLFQKQKLVILYVVWSIRNYKIIELDPHTIII